MEIFKKEYGTCFIVTTSQPTECRFSDWTAVLYYGGILDVAPPEHYLYRFDADNLDDAFAAFFKLREKPQPATTTSSDIDAREIGSGVFVPSSNYSILDEGPKPLQVLFTMKQMREQFQNLLWNRARFPRLMKYLFKERSTHIWRNQDRYFFIAIVLPMLFLLVFYFGIFQNVEKVSIGISKFLKVHPVEFLKK